MKKTVFILHWSPSLDVHYLFPDEILFSTETGGAFWVADNGCQDGGISVPFVKHLIGQVLCIEVSFGGICCIHVPQWVLAKPFDLGTVIHGNRFEKCKMST